MFEWPMLAISSMHDPGDKKMKRTRSRTLMVGLVLLGLAAFSVVTLRAPRRHASPLVNEESVAMADAIYLGGEVVTVNDTQPRAEAVAIRNGRILAVGRKEDVLRHQDDGTLVIDLRGRTVVPGFIDGHSHITRYVTLRGWPDLAPPPESDIQSIDDIVARLRNFIVNHAVPAGQAIFGYNYDDSQLRERRHPSAADLDRISLEHPVVLLHVSTHVASANHAALERAGLLARTSAVRGGWIRRDGRTGAPTGVVEGAAAGQLLDLLPQPSLDEQLRTFDQVQRMYASQGVTTAQDGLTQARALALLRAAADRGRLILDVIAYPNWLDFDSMMTERQARPGPLGYVNQLKIGGVKIVGDGWAQDRTAYLTKPYLHAPGEAADYRGHARVSQAELEQWFDAIYARGLQALMHCNGDACVAMMMDAVSKAQARHGWVDLRPVMLHAETVREDQLDAMKHLGIIPNFGTAHTFYWGNWNLNETVGRERAMHMHPLVWAQRRGMPGVNHSDAPMVAPNPIFLIHTAVNRTGRNNTVVSAGQRSSALDALKAVTLHGAYMYFEEKDKGSIEPGKRADLVVLSHNPLTVAPADIKDIRVLKTIKDGQVIYDLNAPILATRISRAPD
jgi:predicted amidohydrolase YtcJ